jgi:GNAT superfamily N-acetyltransferase
VTTVRATDAEVVLERFRPGLEAAIVALILPIQQVEFGVPITIADQPDLLRIPEVYQAGRGDFWVARMGEEVIGTIGVVDFGGGGALRKMFLRHDHRGSGLGQRLLDVLLAHAHAAGLEPIALGTLGRMHAAHRFYEKNGFRSIAPEDLPAGFPRMPVDDRFYLLRTVGR